VTRRTSIRFDGVHCFEVWCFWSKKQLWTKNGKMALVILMLTVEQAKDKLLAGPYHLRQDRMSGISDVFSHDPAAGTPVLSEDKVSAEVLKTLIDEGVIAEKKQPDKGPGYKWFYAK